MTFSSIVWNFINLCSVESYKGQWPNIIWQATGHFWYWKLNEKAEPKIFLPSKRHWKAFCKILQLSFEIRAAHISHLHNLLFQQLSSIFQKKKKEKKKLPQWASQCKNMTNQNNILLRHNSLRGLIHIINKYNPFQDGIKEIMPTTSH